MGFVPATERFAVASEKRCVHCARAMSPASESDFCCGGCEAVYGILRENHLTRYYELAEKMGGERPTPAATAERDSFLYLDDPTFRRDYARRGGSEMRFHLDGVHCAACLWLVEKIPTFVPGVRRISLDLSSALATVEIAPDGKFSRVAEALDRLGYRPHPVELDEALVIQKRAARRDLLRLGVAGACSGNIMLLAIATYAGAGAEFATAFRWVSFALYLPVLFYSARSFYVSAWRTIRGGSISIDLPIALGITIGSAASFRGIATGDDLYFDSLAGLVFLLLASRYLLARVQARAAEAMNVLQFLLPARARLRAEDGTLREVKSESLRHGQIVEVFPGELFPADGTVVTGMSAVSQSWLTGETKTIAAGPGTDVVAGARNESAALAVRVTASGSETRLSEILRQTREVLASRSETLRLADRLARAFVPATFAMTGVGFAVGARVGFHEGLLRAMAVAIVACPCALAIAIPLAMSVTIGKLAKAGILVRGSDVLENLSKARFAFFDKTGTLTTGELAVTRWEPGRPGLEGIVLALEEKSNHPIAKAIRRRFANAPTLVLTDRTEALGQGVHGVFAGARYALRSRAGDGRETEVELLEDGRSVATLALGDRLRDAAAETIREFRRLGFEVGILSGDRESVVRSVAESLEMPGAAARGGLSPEAKAAIVEARGDAVMIGDGVNDSVALAAASVGIAVRGGMAASLRAAGIYAASGDLRRIAALVRISRETMKVIRRNLAFTILYNVVVISVAIAGGLHPVFAALAMPVSAFSVLGISLGGTRALRKELREIAK